MEYQITNADEIRGQITVKFTRNGDTLGLMALEIPIVDGKFITGETLKAHILTYAPVHLVQRQENIKKASNFEEIKALVVPDRNPATGTPVVSNSPWGQMAPGLMERNDLKALIQSVIDENNESQV